MKSRAYKERMALAILSSQGPSYERPWVIPGPIFPLTWWLSSDRNKDMKMKQCSRTLPKPVRVFGVKGRKVRLRYVVYPPLDRFTAAYRKCEEISIGLGRM